MRLEIEDDKIMDKVAGCVANDIANNLQRYLRNSFDFSKNTPESECFKNQIANAVAQKIHKQLLNDEQFKIKLQGSLDKGVSKAVGSYLSKQMRVEDGEFNELVKLHQSEQVKYLENKIKQLKGE